MYLTTMSNTATTPDKAAKGGLDYENLAFLEIPPYCCRPVTTHRCLNKAQHVALLAEVKSRKNYLYYATVVKTGSAFQAVPPFLVDWDSIPEHPAEVKKQEEAKAKPKNSRGWDRGLSCPFCDHKINSTPGRTLHVKAQHPERLEEYFTLLRGSPQPTTDEDERWVRKSKETMIAADDEDVVDVLAKEEVAPSPALKCPFCGHGVSSTSGRTLHVKNKHPERLSEYLQNVVSGDV